MSTIKMDYTPYRNVSFVKIGFWVAALSILAALCTLDLFQLFRQYKETKPLTLVEIVDDSFTGIRLPNGSVCLFIDDRRLKEDFKYEIMDNFSVENFQQKDVNQAMILAYLFAAREGVIPKTLERTEDDFQTKYDENFWNKLAKYLCNTMNMKLTVFDKTDSSITEPLNFCNAVGTSIPFTSVARQNDIGFCFRLPLNLIALSKNQFEKMLTPLTTTVSPDDNSDDEGKPSVGIHEQEIVFTFQPLAIRRFAPDITDRLWIRVSLPENLTPKGYHDNIGAFFHSELFYPFEINYTKSTKVSAQVSILGTHKPLHANVNCTYTHDERVCIEKCNEKKFSTRCRCNRFMFRYYSTNPKFLYCTKLDYNRCFYNYDRSRWGQPEFEDSLDIKTECSQECDKCSKIFYHVLVKQTESEEPAWQNNIKTCLFYQDFMEKNKIHCDILRENISAYLPYLVADADKNEFELKADFKDPIFGSVTYKFLIESYSYPVFVERASITFAEFKSQIGGIFGLYLGLSGMTAFALISQCVHVLNHIITKRKKPSEKMVLSTPLNDVFHMMTIVGGFNKIERKQSDDKTSDEDEESIPLKKTIKENQDGEDFMEETKRMFAALTNELADAKIEIENLKRQIHN